MAHFYQNTEDTPYVWAIINNEYKTGVTAHIIDESCDTGDIKQIIVPIENNDTGASILEKYAEVYPRLIKEVLVDLKNGANWTPRPFESYILERTPEDALD